MEHHEVLSVNEAIVAHAQAATEALETEHANDPEAELFAWLRIAQRREAMVSEAYTPKKVAAQVEKLSKDQDIPSNIAGLINKALGSIWAQETAHAEYLSSIIRVIDPPPQFLDMIKDRVNRLMGEMEGRVTASLVAPGAVRRACAKLALGVGSLAQETPDFAKRLQAMEFGPYCLINVALEQTAVSSYARMQSLIRTIAAENFDVATSTLALDNARTLKDEKYHRMIFQQLADWAAPPPPPPPGAPGLRAGSENVLQSMTPKKFVELILYLQARVYGTRYASDLEPTQHVFSNEEQLRGDLIVERLVQRSRAEAPLAQTQSLNQTEPDVESKAAEVLAELEDVLPRKVRYFESE